MRAASIIVDETSGKEVGAEGTDVRTSLRRALDGTGMTPDVIFAFYSEEHDGTEIAQTLHELHPRAAILGGSSAGGIMDQTGLHGPSSIGVLMVSDPQGDFGAAARPLDGNPAAAAQDALHAALLEADCDSELPDLIWIFQTPGHEEEVLRGLKQIVGDRCPIVGGSSADSTLSSKWTQICGGEAMSDAVVVCVLFPSQTLGIGFQGAMEPGVVSCQEQRGDGGRITRIEEGGRGRTILEIDGKPAGPVYNRWIGGALGPLLDNGGIIVKQSTMTPLAVIRGSENGSERCFLVHPCTLRPDGALTTFADVEEGEEVHCVRRDPELLIRRASRVSHQAVQQIAGTRPIAAVMTFCGGPGIAGNDNLAGLVEVLKAQLGDLPILVCFTFGEQGPVLGVNKHGNLMISAVVFGS
ncbi:FIST N-terminal domain-containing protein [Breoghania sp.]|uniref:FIST signal transduction protein n=1 Tax=Breoghania sp. TaxID=2065378 RepID=UPI002AA65B5C|nr:FIST N-terminal domain-containing protein [Breoghania sp.]